MRQLQRVIVAMLGVALVGLVPGTVSSAAAGSDGGSYQVETAPSGDDQARAEARRITRSVTFKFLTKRNGKRFTFKGFVQGKKTWIILQRSNTKNGNYRKVRGMRTNHNGYYMFKNPYLNLKCGQKKWYRLRVPGNQRFEPALSRKISVRKRCY